MCRSLRRTGLTLIEMLVTISVCGVALAMIASIGVRQQRVFADLSDQAALSGQLREAAAILPIDLRAAAAGSGDLRDARDTSLEIRGTIAAAVVCDTAPGMLVLAPALGSVKTYTGVLTPIEAGDTIWTLSPNDTADGWSPSRVVAVSNAAAGQCAPLGPRLGDSTLAVARLSVSVAALPAPAIGMPVRVTRPIRYSLYRAADGAWYLGEKEWSNASARFNTIQPVAGPFLAAAAGGLTFRYLDSLGMPLATPIADPRVVALVRVEVRGQTRAVTRALSAAGVGAKRGDSVVVAVFLRNR